MINSKQKIINNCTHYMKARSNRFPPFIMEGTYVYARKIEEKAIGMKQDIYMVSFLNGGKILTKGYRRNGELMLSELKSGRRLHPNPRDIDSLYQCMLVSDEDINIPAHLRPLQDQMI